MIVCPWKDIKKYAALLPGIDEAFDAVNALTEYEDKKNYPLSNGNRFFLAVQSTKPVDLAEAHRNYLDIQYIVKGKEVMGWADLADCKLEGEFNEAKDVGKYSGNFEYMTINEGICYVAFPEDAHMPGRHLDVPNDFVKVVVKLKVNSVSIALDSFCLECHLKRNLEMVRPLGTEAQTMAFARDMMRMYLSAPEGVAAPWFTPHVSELLQKHYGLEEDRFKQEKIDSNRFVLERMDLLREKVTSAADPVLAGLQCAILGNYLDFSALRGQVSFEKLDEMLDKALEMELDQSVFAQLRTELETGKKLLYLTDNAGEIGFDRIFAEQIAARYPHLQITFCVRGGIAQNDATREDAAAVGIPFPVIDNGNKVPGTQIDMMSKEAFAALEEADVILAKGMANCETMHGCGYNVYYAFLVKCQRFVDRFQKPMFAPVLVKERA